jgi:CRISPR-associated endoribonuclease Cas6
MVQLLSLLLMLTPTRPAFAEGFFGRQVQGWLLSQISRHDTGLANRLHAQNNLRPYTVSSLIVPRAGRRGPNGSFCLSPREQCLIRITSLDEELSVFLLRTIKPEPPAYIRLKGIEFQVRGLNEENGWDNQATFQSLMACANVQHGESVTLEFASPTAFRSNGIDISLPVPEQVWRSLWWRWRAFAPEPLHIDPLWPEFAGHCLIVSDYQIRSMKVVFNNGNKGASTGATGQVTYRILPKRRCGEYAPFRQGAEIVLHTLANFALYSGVGHHTTIGLGQTRRLPHSNGPTSDSGEPDEH